MYNQQENEKSAYKEINSKLLRQILKAAKIDAGTGPIMEVLGMIAGSAALLVGLHWITKQSNGMEPEHFFGLLILLGTSAESIRKASDVVNKIQRANAAAERVFAVIDQPVEQERPGAVELETLKEKIEFRDIVFTYPGSNRSVLNGINLTVQAGHNVAIVGSNGSGKTTLVNLLPRFYNPDSGEILIDEQNIQDGTLKSLRAQIAMVTQNVVTFNDTIAKNIAYGKPDATMDEIVDAAKRSFAHEFIEVLPNGYDTVIGESGAGLSGGQLQRIVIARAILKNPPYPDIRRGDESGRCTQRSQDTQRHRRDHEEQDKLYYRAPVQHGNIGGYDRSYGSGTNNRARGPYGTYKRVPTVPEPL